MYLSWFNAIRNPETRRDIISALQSKTDEDVIPNQTITPYNGIFNADCWEILEATNHGFSIQLLADNKNKLVIEPSHLGYGYHYSPNIGTYNPPEYEWTRGDYEAESKCSNWRMIKMYEKLSQIMHAELWNHHITVTGKVESYIVRLHTAIMLESLQYCSHVDDVLVLWLFDFDKTKLKDLLSDIMYVYYISNDRLRESLSYILLKDEVYSLCSL
jgi:hypothetical protein